MLEDHKVLDFGSPSSLIYRRSSIISELLCMGKIPPSGMIDGWPQALYLCELKIFRTLICVSKIAKIIIFGMSIG